MASTIHPFSVAMRRATREAAAAQPRFTQLVQNILVGVAAVLMVDAFLFRDHLRHLAAAVPVTSVADPSGAELLAIALSPEATLAGLAVGLGLLGAIVATVLVVADAGLLIGARLYRQAVRREQDL